MTNPDRFDTTRPQHVTRHRALFISDVHLGTRTSQAEALLEFLRLHEADTIYLVGDIIDFWRVKRGVYWPQTHNDVLQKLLRQVRKGTRIIFIPGNHDEGIRDFCGMTFGGIEIHRNILHKTATGKTYIVMHGDEFDVVVRTAEWLAVLGDRGYEFALWLNTPLNWVRRHMGFGYWSLSAYLKGRVKQAVSFIGKYEAAVASEARRHGADGIICGHIHKHADLMMDGVHYLNCGDWVESCTAIGESRDGVLQIIRWSADLKGATVPDADVTRPDPADADLAHLANAIPTVQHAAAFVAMPSQSATVETVSISSTSLASNTLSPNMRTLPQSAPSTSAQTTAGASTHSLFTPGSPPPVSSALMSATKKTGTRQ